jgi:LPXTG-motif cell wall-anchored protein
MNRKTLLLLVGLAALGGVAVWIARRKKDDREGWTPVPGDPPLPPPPPWLDASRGEVRLPSGERIPVLT